MAGSSLLTLIDDIASVLDDVAALTKVAAQKSAGVLGDDLALNVEQVVGVRGDREIPVVLAVAKGSAINKVILVPAALLISAVFPPLITVLLLIGGAYLSFEGFEKVLHKILHRKEESESHQAHKRAALDPSVDLVALEKQKIRGAIRTDFILSAEIIIIALGSLPEGTSLLVQTFVLIGIATTVTVGVYGLVAGIVRIDDLGAHLIKTNEGAFVQLGHILVRSTPYLMRFLGIVGTVAMFLVGGGIVAHKLPGLSSGVHALVHGAGTGFWAGAFGVLLDGVIGVATGGLVYLAVERVKKARAS